MAQTSLADILVNCAKGAPFAKSRIPAPGNRSGDFAALRLCVLEMCIRYRDTSGYPFTTLKGIYVDSDIAFSDTENRLSKLTGSSDWAGARWTGRLVAPSTREYNFYFYSDNGARLYIEDMEMCIRDRHRHACVLYADV